MAASACIELRRAERGFMPKAKSSKKVSKKASKKTVRKVGKNMPAKIMKSAPAKTGSFSQDFTNALLVVFGMGMVLFAYVIYTFYR